MPLDPQVLLKQSTHQVSCHLDEKLVILNTKSGSYFEINSIGSTIWDKMAQARSLDSIVTELQQEYDQSEERIKVEALDFIETLIKNDLLNNPESQPN